MFTSLQSNAQPSSATASRSNNYDMLRLLLALTVLLAHCFLVCDGDNRSDLLFRATLGRMDGGYLAVNGFFLISGFLVTASWLGSRGLADYLQKRALRIYPGFVANMLFTALVFGPIASGFGLRYLTHVHLPTFLENLVLLQSPQLPPLFTRNPDAGVINASLWTIRYEFLCYLLVVGLGWSGAFRARASVAALALAAWATYAAQTAGLLPWLAHAKLHLIGDPIAWPRFATYFLFGSVAYLYREQMPHSRKVALGAVTVLVAACAWRPGFEMALPWCGSYLLFHTAYSHSLRLHRVAAHGDLSYGLYLYAFPVQQLCVQWLGTGATPLRVALVALPATLGLAALSWHLVERPSLSLRRSNRSRNAT